MKSWIDIGPFFTRPSSSPRMCFTRTTLGTEEFNARYYSQEKSGALANSVIEPSFVVWFVRSRTSTRTEHCVRPPNHR